MPGIRFYLMNCEEGIDYRIRHHEKKNAPGMLDVMPRNSHGAEPFGEIMTPYLGLMGNIIVIGGIFSLGKSADLFNPPGSA